MSPLPYATAFRRWWFFGDCVFEIRPRVDWHKGTALAWIARRLEYQESLAIFIGDDQTDEDAFRFLNEAITVKVGGHATTWAKYHVEGPEEVVRFLRWLAHLRKEKGE